MSFEEIQTPPRSFAFLLTPISFVGAAPVEIIDDHFLKSASLEQISQIKEFLRGFTSPIPFDYFYECALVQDASGSKTTGIRQTPDKWNYWVIEFGGLNHFIGDLALAMGLLDDEIEIGFERVYHAGLGWGHGWMPGSVSSYLDSTHSLIFPLSVTIRTLDAIKTLFEAVRKHESQKSPTYKILQRFRLLRRLPRDDPFYTLAHFTLLEALITHNPSETGDGLTRQMATKMTLLSKRFQPPLASKFGTSISMRKLWEKLYCYRSCIAHGASPDFAGSKLRGLISDANVRDFVRLTVKRLLIFTMNDPEFVADLREC